MSIRLTIEIRHALNSMVREKITYPAFDDAEEKAREALFEAITNSIEREFPQKDMKVLAKYDCAEKFNGWHCVMLFDSRRVDMRSSYSNDPVLPVPFKSTLLVRHRPVIRLNADETAVYDKWATARVQQTTQQEKGWADYYALIKGSTTLEQVEKVWPAAAAVRTKINRSLPVIVLDDVIKRIAADQKKRAA